MNESNRIVKGAIWAFAERFSMQLVAFGVSITLARLLTPTDYGTIALLTIFTAIAGVLAESGFGNALVQKKNATELDYNSVFYFSLGLTAIIYLVLFFLAPFVARFYRMPILCPVLRVVSLSLFFNAINSVQNAELNRKLLFHLSFRISLMSTIASAIVGITFACLGLGVWALVWMNIASGVVGVVSRWFIIAWRPRLMFSFSALGPLFKFGWKLSLSGLLNTGFNNLYGLIIGRVYSPADLSFVNKGRNIPELVMNNIDGTLGRVAFPVLSRIQDNRTLLRESMRRMMIVSTFFVFPLMTLCAVTAEKSILFLYGEKWLPAAPYAMIACFTFALWPFHTINLQGIQALGRSDVFLNLEIIKKAIALVVLISCLSQSVLLWCLVGAFVSSPLSVIINSWPNRKLLDYSIRMQIGDVLPTAMVCVIVAIPIGVINFIPMPSTQLSLFACLMVQGILAVVLFIGFAALFHLRGIREVSLVLHSRVTSKWPSLLPIFTYLERE